MGLRGKTDRVDAQLIAHEHARLHPWLPSTREQYQLDRLLRRRAKLSQIRAALTQSVKGLDDFAPQIKALVAKLNALIECIDTRLRTLTESSAQRREGYARLRRIVGVGPIVGSGVLNSLQRLTFAKADSFVAFCGLDPRPDDSGRHRGRRRLSKRGPSELRRLLYNAALSASRTKTWKPLYERELAKGWSRTEAVVILARRIARTAWSVYTHKSNFDPQRITLALT